MSKTANQPGLFAMTNHDGFARTVPAGADEIRTPPRRPGKRRETARDVSREAKRHVESTGQGASIAAQLLRYYAEAHRKRPHLGGLTDREAHAMFERDGWEIRSSSMPSARRTLTEDYARPLIEKGEKRKCSVSTYPGKVQPWRLSAAGWEAVAR